MFFLHKRLFVLMLFLLSSCSDFFLSELDDCGVPAGDNTCVDCSGTPNGQAAEDDCGICVGGNSPIQEAGTTLDCFGNCPDCADTADGCLGDTGSYVSPDVDQTNCCAENEKDECGICNGNNSSCTGCMIIGSDNYSPSNTIEDNESCFINYDSTIQPIFDNHCIACHGSSGEAGLNLLSYQTLLSGGNNGSVLVLADSTSSILFQVISPPDATMPPTGSSLSSTDIHKIGLWIQFGALEGN